MRAGEGTGHGLTIWKQGGRWGHIRESSQWGTGVPGAQRRGWLRSAAVSQIQAPLNRTIYLFHRLGSESISNFQKISSPRG